MITITSYRNCMWLQLSQVKKKFVDGNMSFYLVTLTFTKVRKIHVVIYLNTWSCDTMYRVRNQISK